MLAKYPLTWGDAVRNVCLRTGQRNADRDRGAESDGGHLRVAEAGKRSGPTLRQGRRQRRRCRDECHRATSDGRPVRRAVGGGGTGRMRGCATPTGAASVRSSRRRIGGPGLPGAAGRRRDGNGPGNRGPGRQRGIARQAFGHDGRCEVEREANASRSTIGGWFVPLSCPGQRSGSGRSAPGAVRFFRTRVQPSVRIRHVIRRSRALVPHPVTRMAATGPGCRSRPRIGSDGELAPLLVLRLLAAHGAGVDLGDGEGLGARARDRSGRRRS